MQNMLDVEHLNEGQKQQVLGKLNDMQMQDSLNTYNGLVERCFNECITHFRAKDLEKAETGCIERCVTKFMAFSQRIGTRFQEKNMQQATPPSQ
ncbi:unnamed protein product [Vitrella brassicaformis CCMP3155]|uniref:Mitochondrial import inner membrane translocase subunit n=1 Tax=Vitrella brassicaformis (strain CCMP3155) TaxID=1169540 RepID=A0A0G4EQD6_VITBC|nr:unnamed protein product [Vitrella brassicaformis CCMP3155]|mmetsp:Transcript_911/g.2034  ORF Transcript_911/g.2034 Transcript_911/m.2034 type:complete len:94 (+) Transcript_911:109-390(+)|eukprot:CEM00005.1 unnamed protein product [Vitrella brassicaformis CCMP3155]